MSKFSLLLLAALVSVSSATELEYIFYANATHVMYVSSNGGASTVIRSATNSKLGYDPTTRRLYVFDEVLSKLYSMKLDGSDSQELYGIGGGVKRFIVDDMNEKIYYISKATDYTNSRNFNGTAATELLSAGNNDLTDIQVDPMRQLLFFAADDTSERDLVVYNITSGEVRTLFNANSSSIRLTIDRLNRIIYWISYNADSSLMLRKTDYSGNTTLVASSFGQSGRPAITQIGDYYYVLDSTESIIRKFDKRTDTIVQNITVIGGTTEIIGTNDVDECLENPCHPLASCTNFLAGYSCVCLSGYTGSGNVCDDINECNVTGNSLCSDDSFCVNTNGSYRCDCNPGYLYNGTLCIDIDECENGSDCHVNATCTNNIGSYTCACDSGFSGNGTICEDLKCYIDSIYLATASEIYVLSNGLIITTLISATNAQIEYDKLTKRILYFDNNGNTLYTMKLDGTNRTVISSGIQMSAFTIDYVSRYVYYVSAVDNDIGGFPISDNSNISNIIPDDDSVRDVDFDAVSRVLFFSNSDNHGDIGRYNLTTASEFVPAGGFPGDVSVDENNKVVYWTNFMGGNYEVKKTYYNQSTFQLKLYSGSIASIRLAQGERYLYVLNPTRSELDIIDKESEEVVVTYNVKAATNAVGAAEDVDECCLGSFCHVYATCTNKPGGYDCECMPGFTGNDTYCEDIDECQNTSICHENATCDNNPGSYTCTCNTGLSGDGRDSCVVFNPCDHDNCDSNAFCTANEDNSFNCTCNSGYTGNGTYCRDIDECNEGAWPCHANATCDNGVGNFTCTCKDGFRGNETHCSDINECHNATYPCHPDADCENIPGNFTCMCKAGFSGDGQDCLAIDCEVLNCGTNEVCLEVDGLFQCVCHPDYTGENCEEEIRETCLARGDPHYTTFDGTHYDFMGMCEYVLARDFRNSIFEIRQVNEPCGNGLVACTKSLSLVIPGFIVSLERNRVRVNGSTVTLPANYTGAMHIHSVGGETRVDTNYGVYISWNNVYNVKIDVLGRYLNSVSGLCGTFNDDMSDDLLTSGNMTTTNVTEFGNSWKTDPTCADAPTVQSLCDANPARAAIARSNCSALLQAPFWLCNSTVNATDEYFIADCEYDMCACDSNPDACLCQIFDAYASACSAENVVFDWIGHFPQCTTPCASSPCFNGATCINEDESSYSCQCPDGYIGDQCNIRDVCNIPVFVYYGGSEISYKVTISNVTTSGSLVSGEATDVDYDPVSRRLFYYVSGNFYSVKLDGSDVRQIQEENQVVRFTVDGRNNVIYFIFESTDTIYTFNITNLQTNQVDDLADVTGAKDIDMDIVNGYLVIAKTSGDRIVRYSIATKQLDSLHSANDFPQSVSVDADNEAVYWVNFDSDDAKQKVMSTSYAGDTNDLNITFDGSIEIAQDELYLYVLDVSNEIIYKYKKSTWEQMGTSNVASGTSGIEVAFDEDECCIGTFCHEQSTCANSVANFTCTCNPGYAGNGTFCEDIDECDIGRCHANASCSNSPGSFTCVCNTGFTGDGVDCAATNCSVLACGKNQVCENVGGIFQCVCHGDYTGSDCSDLLQATCLARGDPHYTSFDGRRYDFMGRCEYVLAKESVNNTFEIRQVNEPCGNGEPSCTKSLTVIFRSITIELRRGSVVINGSEIDLSSPYKGPDVNITQPKEGVTLVESDYGVTVEWNNVHNVRVTVLGRYLNRTSGLCGTFNRDSGDDFWAQNGTTLDNAVDFGNSWKTDPGCEDATDVGHPCDTYSERNATAVANCSALLTSPFNNCAGKINPESEGYIEDCEYDVCGCDDNPTVCLCQAIEAYVSDCASEEVTIDWLNDPRYQQCGTPCASAPCFNGGTCTNDGQMFSCSCDVGFAGDRCEIEVLSCDDLICSKNEICVAHGDTYRCVCDSDYEGDNCEKIVQATCKAQGDPHYTTFDGRRFDFMGKCEYVLAKDIVNNTFEIRQANEPCGNGVPTCTRSLTAVFPGLTIELRRGMILVNDSEIRSPAYYDGVNITGNGNTVVTSVYGVTVNWNNVYNVRVTVRGRYINKTAGLCGSYNDKKEDDFWTSYGTTVTDPVDFGNSWKVDPECENATEVDHPCDTNRERRWIARANCSRLLSAPFNSCAIYINASEEGYIEDCEYDMCACEDDPTVCYCQALDAYSEDCASYVDIAWEEMEEFDVCNTPCASAPCYNGGSCTNVGNSFECRCPPRFLGDRCQIEDRCQLPYVYFSGSSNVQSYNTDNSSERTTIVLSRPDALLSFDAVNKRLYTYTGDDEIISYDLDGSNSTKIDLPNVEFFTVDGQHGVIYFYHSRVNKIYIYDIANEQDSEVGALSAVSSVKDLDMDLTNGYLFIASAGSNPITRYKPQDQSIMHYNYDGSAQSITIDDHNNDIYWVNYNGDVDVYEVLRTTYNGETMRLNITYAGSIVVANDVFNLYVLDKERMRIDKYLKTSLERLENITINDAIADIVIGYDVDECCVGTFCPVGSTCSNSLGGFDCTCNDGFYANETNCDDVDECKNDPCHQNATCVNTIGTFDCECDEGFQGDGFDCQASNCSILTCKENEECVQVNNIFTCACKPDYEGPDCQLVEETCQARGDPHYSTFDGRRYDFMGRCEYVLAKDTVNNTFEIRQVNEPCGNGEPSCTKSLTVIFPNITIQLRRGSVVINGSEIDLTSPYEGRGVNITQPKDRVTLVESDYGVTVEWNNVHNVRVTVLGRYLNRTSGLCGTFNRNSGDDFWAQNGTTLDNAVHFGNSWKTDPGCEDATDVGHPCDTYPERNATAVSNCSALSASPFNNCAGKIDPESEGYIEDCEYDVCACDDDPTVCLCQAIEAYVSDCASEEVTIDWLSDSRYQQCATPCASAPCFNGGTCSNDGGSLFSCSCPVGYTGVRCEIEVTSCDDLSCDENEICVEEGDTYQCVCHPDYDGDDCEEKMEATCNAKGDPHYTTFDGRRFDFMGKCEYVLAKDIVNNTFEIRQANEPCGNGVPTCTRSLTVIFPGLTIELRRGTTLVNGTEISSSAYYNGVNITQSERDRTLVTSVYGVTVNWNNVYNVRVTIGGRYINKTAGLCGTYNEIKDDDFWTSYGATVTDVVEFGNSWKVDPECENATEVDHPCDSNPDRRWIARANCSRLLTAPFNSCATYINASEEGYIEDCEYDMCACEDNPAVCYCQALEAYAEDCAAESDIQWEHLAEFDVCATPCASAPCFNGGTCRNIGNSSFECTCPFGFLGGRCELEDLCQVPILYYANSSAIYSYNTKADENNFFLRSVATKLVFDKRNRQILTYDSAGTLSTVSLDGLNITTLVTDETTIGRFTYDAGRNIIYYLHNAIGTIHMLNLTSMQDNEIAALAHVSDIKDLDIDVLNDYLVIVTTSNLSIVLYDLGDSLSVRVISYDGGFAQSLYVFEDGTIYWVNYDPNAGRFCLLATSVFTGATTDLGIWYDSEICVVVTRLYVYVLDKENNRIDFYPRRTLKKIKEVHVIANVQDLILGFDIDECCSNNTCHTNATCSNTPGSFVCTCNEGFELNGDDCIDINECNLGRCDPNADCLNTEGSFYCTCISGFTGNGINCTETCEEEMLFYSTSSGIVSNSSVVLPTTDSILGYDGHNRKLLYYNDGTGNFYSANLDGSNSTVLINVGNVDDFAYDGRRNVLYYLHKRTLKINSVNITSEDDAPVDALGSLSAIRGLEMDIKNGYLTIAKSSEPPIVRVDVITFEIQDVDFDGSAQALSVDQDYSVVYWDNFDGDTEKHNLTRTSWETEETEALNVSYDGEIDLAQDYMHLYVLDKDNNRIDKYDKRTWAKVDSFSTLDEPLKVIVAFDYDECCVGTYCPHFSICTNTPSSFGCMCEKGYFVNETACRDINECAMENDCHVNATCTNTDGSYNCTCRNGTTGDGFTSCEDVDECMVGGFCHANATCDNTYGSYSCECYEGFTGDGTNCTDIVECDGDHPCHVNATCNDIPGSYECNCFAGFTGNGTDCDDVDECEDEPCHNNATCENTIGSFICRCTGRFRGDGFDCEEFVECTDNSTCDENALCNNVTGTPVCTCIEGFAGNGSVCEDENECNMTTYSCHEHAFCNNTIGSFECICEDGFDGNETYCEDIDECNENGHDCDGNATCTNTIGDYNCTCYDGFSGDGFDCEDINECDGENDCHANATCTNTDGSYNCSCNDGYEGNGTHCQDVIDCNVTDSLCHGNATCNDIPGSYECNCFKGFTGNGTYCEDVNECDDEDICPNNSTCFNSVGSYNCTCNDGFVLNGTVCVDILECLLGTDDCHDNANCTDTIGSYTCQCLEGFTGNGTDCNDIDECSTADHNCHNNATCTNTTGSFTCACKEGFTGNGVNCSDIDECARELDDCHANANCTNLLGSYTCQCKEGFTGDGKSCQDIDECSTGGHNCDANATCTNVTGSFTCACSEGFTGSGVNCTDINECSTGRDDCHDEHAICTNIMGSYTCQCKKGFSGDGKSCEDVKECSTGTHTCHDNATCSETIGSFNCTCQLGFTGNGTFCEDINECENGCPEEANCTNLIGRCEYTCLPGFEGLTCVDLNECQISSTCSDPFTCRNFYGTYSCDCPVGQWSIAGVCSEAYVFNLSFEILEGLDYSDDLADTSSKNHLIALRDVEKAVDEQFRGSSLSGKFLGSRLNSFSRGTGTNSATASLLQIYFRPTLIQNDINDDIIGREFRNELSSVFEDNVSKLRLANRYVLARNNLPNPSANVVDFNECSSNPCVPSVQRCSNFLGSYRCYCSNFGQIISENGQCINVIILQGTLTIYNLGPFDTSLLIVNSLSWLRLSLSVENALNEAYKVSSLVSQYRGSQVTGFSEGSVVVSYESTFDPSSNVTISSAQDAIAKVLNMNSSANGTFLGVYRLSQDGSPMKADLTYTAILTPNPTSIPTTTPTTTSTSSNPPLDLGNDVNDEDRELVKWLTIGIIIYLGFCFLVTFFISIAICRILSHPGKYVQEEDEISMGRVTSIVTPKYEEREAIRKYYS